MSVEIRMPQVASDMTEADVVSWLIEPGESVRKGDVLLEIETEKSTVEIEAPASGTLREILVPGGATNVEVGTLLAVLDAAEDAAAEAPSNEATPDEPESPAPQATPAAPQPIATPSTPTPSAPTTGSTPAGVVATALARRVAEQAGVDLSQVSGTGPHGRITRDDVELLVRSEQPGGELVSAHAAPGRDTPALLQLTANCRFDALAEVIDRLNGLASSQTIAPLHAIARAAALAASETLESPHGDPISVAIGVPTPTGLALPVVGAADRKGLGELAREIEALREGGGAQDGVSEETDAGALAVVDLGVDGIDGVRLSTSPPRSCVLGVGAPRAEPVVQDGQVVAGTTVLLTLTVDRSAVAEPRAAQLLAGIRERIERPVAMLV